MKVNLKNLEEEKGRWYEVPRYYSQTVVDTFRTLALELCYKPREV
jgi:hypothetical protein